MDSELTLLTQRLSQAVGDYRVSAVSTVVELAHPVDVVDAGLPIARLELVFRSPHVSGVAVRDPSDESRIGLVTRGRFTSAMNGRLGFGRAVLARRATTEVTDWHPMVVAPDAPVSEVAVRAMERHDERRYDDVLVAADVWQVATTADLVRSLSTQLAVRSLHDPLTGLANRSMLGHALARRCTQAWGTPARVALVLIDVRDFGGVNALHGERVGDVVLAAVGARLRASAPTGADLGRTGGDEFALAATLPGAADDRHASALVGGLRDGIVQALAEPAAGVPVDAWPAVHAVSVVSDAGLASAPMLLQDAHARLREVKVAAARGGGGPDWLDGLGDARAILEGRVTA
ncbi:GGDEF domain-containing protein [Cellulomonas alba]|uniref:GGDEF domain-containing protein n=1 Tax=Cellulomonas alba TaxID=3053467 RepID=A0ABT7SER3_9CELL|nr:GGDEF domain-containing protein [Cellulomonas alba]MDM7854652.1 GGDEF domain-containing protein [Cellulomonas alba]